MACPTCDHTMKPMGKESPALTVFWCPRCGTVKLQGRSESFIERPRLVDRCRAFERKELLQIQEDAWHCIGIDEAIRLPADRRLTGFWKS